MRASHINPKLSSEEKLNGEFYFKKTPLAFTVTKIILSKNGPRNKKRRHLMVLKVSMWAELLIITGAKKFMRKNLDPKGLKNP